VYILLEVDEPDIWRSLIFFLYPHCIFFLFVVPQMSLVWKLSMHLDTALSIESNPFHESHPEQSELGLIGV
jgi:hypothetical protein